MWRILIVDDQEVVRQGLKAMLEQDKQMTVPYEAANGEESIRILEKQHSIDIVLMDVSMPVMNGIEATRIIRNRWPHIKILILTTFNDEAYAAETLKEGVGGFLLKTANASKLREAVYSMMVDGLPIHEEVAAKVIPYLLQQKEQTPKSQVDLTVRELAIVQLVGEAKTNKEIASTLFLSVGTVKNHITTVLQKLDCRDRTQLAIYAVKHHLS